MASSSAAAVAGNMPAPATRLEPDAIGVAQDMVIGMASSAPAATIGLVAGRARRGDRLRQRAGPAADRGPDDDHRERLPPVQHVERQLRGVVRVGRPGDQPLPGVPHRVADGRRLHHRHGRGDPAARPLGAGGVRLHLHRTPGRGSPSAAWSGVVMLVIAVVGIKITAKTQVGMALVEYLILIGPRRGRPGLGAQPPPGHAAHHQGLVQPVRHRRQGRRGGRVPDRGVRLRRLGRHPVRQRRGQAPAAPTRGGRRSSRSASSR